MARQSCRRRFPFAIVVVTILALIYMRVRDREEWMAKAQLVFEQSGSSH